MNKVAELRKLLEIFPSKGRDAQTTELLRARKRAIEERLQLLEREAQEKQRKQSSSRGVKWVEYLQAKESTLQAPRCILTNKHYDEDGNILEVNLVLAKYIGELEPNSSLVAYHDCGGAGYWVPQYQYPKFRAEDVPEEVVNEIHKEWEEEYTNWKELTNSLQKVERIRYYTYFGDSDDLKEGAETIVKWVTPTGKELPYPPSQPASIEDRIESWWWENVIRPMKPQIEAEWRTQAIGLLNSHGWEVR